MNTFIAIMFLLVIGIAVYYWVLFASENIRYREMRREEIKERLKTEHRQEAALKELLLNETDDFKRFELENRFSAERHQRAIAYVLQDVFERNS